MAELALRLSTYCACTICVGNLLGLGLNEGTVRRYYYYFSLPQGRPGVRTFVVSSLRFGHGDERTEFPRAKRFRRAHNRPPRTYLLYKNTGLYAIII